MTKHGRRTTSIRLSVFSLALYAVQVVVSIDPAESASAAAPLV